MVCLSPIITQIKVNNLIIDRCSPCPLLLTAGSPPSIFLHFANSCSPLRAAHPWKGRATPPPTFPGSAHWLLSGPTIAEQYGRPCPNTGIRFLPLNWSAALIPVNLVLYIYLLSGSDWILIVLWTLAHTEDFWRSFLSLNLFCNHL